MTTPPHSQPPHSSEPPRQSHSPGPGGEAGEGPLRLEPVAGPSLGVITIARDKPAVIGRAVGCDVCLLHEGVSRRHAMVRCKAGAKTGTGTTAGLTRWYVTDMGSSPGTFVGGVRLRPDEPTEVMDGDLLRVGPWTFRVELAAPGPGRAGTRNLVRTLDDRAGSTLGVSLPTAAAGASHRLEQLIECTMKLMDAPDALSMARVVLDAALAGTGYARGAVLGRPGGGDEVEVVHVAGGGGEGHAWAAGGLSRSLVREAALGRVASLTDRSAQRATERTIQELDIHSAVCAPVSVGPAVVALLYLDARGAESRVRADAASFCAALGRVYGLAIGSAARAELEGRRAALEAELRAAREAQQLIMPSPAGELCGVRYAVRSVPGQFVAGDLFDAVELPGPGPGDGRVAVSLGDVSGHGAGPAIMMASTQAYLNAALARSGGLAEAVGQLNRYVCARSGAGRFVSLWAGVLDPRARTLTYVDAGHGHWLLAPADPSRAAVGRTPGGIPLGIDVAYAYAHAEIGVAAGDRIVLYSDGLLEQRSPSGEEFGAARVRSIVEATRGAQETADALMAAVEKHAGRAVFDDDTTIAVVEIV